MAFIYILGVTDEFQYSVSTDFPYQLLFEENVSWYLSK